MASKFVITAQKNGQYRFELKTKHGDTLLASATYDDKANVLDGIQAVRKHSQFDSSYDRSKTKTGDFYFTLKTTTGETVGTSETYNSKATREKAIESLIKHAPDALIEDKTQ